MPLIAIALLLVTSLVSPIASLQTSSPQTGSVTGIVVTREASPVSNATVQLRNVASSTVIATERTNSKGAFVFDKVDAGRYVVEAVALKGDEVTIVGTSQPLPLAAGESVVTKVILNR